MLLDASPNAAIGVDDAGIIRYLNWRAENLFGYRERDIVGRPVETLIDPALAQQHRAYREAFLAAPESRPMAMNRSITGRRADGSAVPVEVNLTAVDTGTGTWVFAAIRDVRAWRANQEQLAELTRVYQTLAEMNQAIVRSEDAQTLYDSACRIAVGSGGYMGAFVGRAQPDNSIVAVASAGRLNDYIAGLALTTDPDKPQGNGPTALALREGRFHYSAEFLTDVATAPWRESAARHGIRASATLPLRCADEVVAAMMLYSDVADIFDTRMRTLLEGMAANISFALERFHTDAELRRTVAQRGTLLARLVEAQEEERAKIAADVHDDPVQVLSAVDLRLGSLQRRLVDRAPELVDMLEQSRHAVAAANQRLRMLLFDLEPVARGLVLTDALRDVAANVFEGTASEGIVHWTVDGDGDLPAAERQQAVRVAKEALNNVRTHANASTLRISANAVGAGVEIAIVDDGVGVDPETVRSAPGHRGLASMRDRAEIAGGWLRLEGGVDGGTTVRFWIPGVPTERPPSVPAR